MTIAVFVWTLSDAIGLGFLALVFLYIGVIYVVDWCAKRIRKKRQSESESDLT